MYLELILLGADVNASSNDYYILLYYYHHCRDDLILPQSCHNRLYLKLALPTTTTAATIAANFGASPETCVYLEPYTYFDFVPSSTRRSGSSVIEYETGRVYFDYF